jgi:hypothetical protein
MLAGIFDERCLIFGEISLYKVYKVYFFKVYLCNLLLFYTSTGTYITLKKHTMLTKFLQLSQSSGLNKKIHRRQVFAFLLGSLPILAAAPKEQASIHHTKKTGYGKGAYGG